MWLNKKHFFCILVIFFSISALLGGSLATDYSGDSVVLGLSNIQPGDSLEFGSNTIWATLTANWGVRVTFVDWDNSELVTTVVHVTDKAPGKSRAPGNPVREGWTFNGWERIDQNGDTSVSLNSDGSVTGITGPGPIVFKATYLRDQRIGSVIVEKFVQGNAGEDSRDFCFRLTLSNEEINGKYGAVEFVNGVADFTLRSGERIIAEGLPEGVNYTVVENDYSVEGYTTEKYGDTGAIIGDSAAIATFINIKNVAPVPEHGNLCITKKVTGDLADKTQYFSFKIDLGCEGVFHYGGSKNGTVQNGGTIKLKHGESVTIMDIPAGTSYAVTESGNKGYVVYANGNIGKIAVGNTAIAKFVNTKSSVPKTGDNSNNSLWICLMGISGLGMFGSIFRKNRNEKKKIRRIERF